MSLAVLDISGKQFSVKEGTSFWVDKMDCEVGAVLALRRVVFFLNEGGARLGEPFDKDMVAFVRVYEHARDKKVLVFKKKRRHGYRRLKGFRADQTCLEVVALQEATDSLNKKCGVGDFSGALEADLIPVVQASKKKEKPSVAKKGSAATGKKAKAAADPAPKKAKSVAKEEPKKKKESGAAAPKKAVSAAKKAAPKGELKKES